MFFSFYNYFASAVIFAIGFYILIISGNLIKKLVGLSLIQNAILIMYISISYVSDGSPPLIKGDNITLYHHPLPHVLMLTAIVVGISTLVTGLAIIIRIKRSFGSIESADLSVLDREI